MNKPLPNLASDEEAEAFVETADLADYDLSAMTPMGFEFAPKSARVNMRLPAPLLERVKAKAASQSVPYQRFIRQALESAIAPKSRSGSRPMTSLSTAHSTMDMGPRSRRR